MNLENVIKELISLNKEGDSWDFKLKHHSNSAELVHDVLCLANNIHAKGSRYLIFGVAPSDYSIQGVQEQQNRQAEILDILSAARFAGGVYPDVSLQALTLDGKRIDVLIIRDTKDKPFYLEKEYAKTSKEGTKPFTVNAGTIYSRVRDRNTARNEVATYSDIEKMWRQKFGLDDNPTDKIYRYLGDPKNWQDVSGRIWYYKTFPEFTVEISEHSSDVGPTEDCWVRAATNPSAYYSQISLKYHQTILWSGMSVTIDGARARLMCPDSIALRNNRPKREIFFAYTKDSMNYRLNDFLISQRGSHHPYSIEKCLEPVVFFASEDEKIDFRAFLEAHVDEIDEQEYAEEFDYIEHDVVRNDLIFSKRIKNFYEKISK